MEYIRLKDDNYYLHEAAKHEIIRAALARHNYRPSLLKRVISLLP